MRLRAYVINKMFKENNNITIIGAGLTGLAFCNLLRNTDVKINLIDINPKSFYENLNIDRHIVLSNTSKVILEKMGLWQEISIHCNKLKDIHISKKNIFGSTLVKSSDENLESLGYQVPVKELVKIFYHNIQNVDNLEIAHNAEVTSVEPGEKVKITLTHDSQSKNIESRSVIFSTGATDELVDSIFFEKVKKDYKQNAVTCEVISDQHNTEIAFERFTNEGILGLIPRKENSWTLIYSTNQKESDYINNLDNLESISYFQELLGNKCGNIQEIRNMKTYPLKLKYHKSFTKDNICLLGDAAHTLHPIAAQSFNLSLRDCAYLTKLIKSENLEKNNLSKMYKNYHLKRIDEVNRLVKFTDALASFVHGTSFIKNNLISMSFLFMDMNKNLRVNIIRYLLGVNFSKSLISNSEE